MPAAKASKTRASKDHAAKALSPPEKRPTGRPPHRPTDETRTQVQVLAGVAFPHDQIARSLGIDKKTLHRHYRDELDDGIAKTNGAVVGNLFRIATGDGREAVSAAIFWMKTRLGWRDVAPIQAQIEAKVEHSGQVDTKLVHDFRADPQMVAAVAKVLLEAGVGIEDQSGEDKP